MRKFEELVKLRSVNKNTNHAVHASNIVMAEAAFIARRQSFSYWSGGDAVEQCLFWERCTEFVQSAQAIVTTGGYKIELTFVDV